MAKLAQKALHAWAMTQNVGASYASMGNAGRNIKPIKN